MQNPLGEAEATKKCKADTLRSMSLALEAGVQEMAVGFQALWRANTQLAGGGGGGGGLQIPLVFSIGSFFNLYICSELRTACA